MKRIEQALKQMIEYDETMRYITVGNGKFSEEDENAPWLKVLQEAQEALYEATGELVPNSLGVLLIPEKEDPNSFGFAV